MRIEWVWIEHVVGLREVVHITNVVDDFGSMNSRISRNISIRTQGDTDSSLARRTGLEHLVWHGR